jgi:YgiT-type zinc finger domain-containing protein
MNCTTCTQGALRPGMGTFEVDHEGTKLTVKDVPALVCDRCGDEYFEGTIAAELIREAEQAARNGISSNVRQYVAA